MPLSTNVAFSVSCKIRTWTQTYIFPVGALAYKHLMARTLAYLPSYLQAFMAVFLLMFKLLAICS